MSSQSFISKMIGVNIWDHVVKDQEIMRMSKSCLTGEGNVFQRRDFKAHVKGSVKIINPSCYSCAPRNISVQTYIAVDVKCNHSRTALIKVKL